MDLGAFLSLTLSTDQGDQDRAAEIMETMKSDKNNIITYISNFPNLDIRLKRVAAVHISILMKCCYQEYNQEELVQLYNSLIEILSKYSKDTVIASNVLLSLSIVCLLKPEFIENTASILPRNLSLKFLKNITSHDIENSETILNCILRVLPEDILSLNDEDFTNFLFIILNISNSVDLSLIPNIKEVIRNYVHRSLSILSSNYMRTFWMLLAAISQQCQFEQEYINDIIVVAISVLYNEDGNWEENSSVLCFLSMFTEYITEEMAINIITQCVNLAQQEYIETEQVYETLNLANDFLERISQENIIQLFLNLSQNLLTQDNFTCQNLTYFPPLLFLLTEIIDFIGCKFSKEFLAEIVVGSFATSDVNIIQSVLFFLRDAKIEKFLIEFGAQVLEIIIELLESSQELAYQAMIFDVIDRIIKYSELDFDKLFEVFISAHEIVGSDSQESYFSCISSILPKISKLDEEISSQLLKIVQNSPESSIILLKGLLSREETRQAAAEISQQFLISIFSSESDENHEVGLQLFGECLEHAYDAFSSFANEMKEIILKISFGEETTTKIRSSSLIILSQLCMKSNDTELANILFENIMPLFVSPRERIFESLGVCLSNILRFIPVENTNQLCEITLNHLMTCDKSAAPSLLLIIKNILETNRNEFVDEKIVLWISGLISNNLEFCSGEPNALYDEDVFEVFADIVSMMWNSRIAENLAKFLFDLINGTEDEDVLYLSIGAIADINAEMFHGNGLASTIIEAVMRRAEATDNSYVRQNTLYLLNQYHSKQIISNEDFSSLSQRIQ